jgi:hypothetical protein
MFNGCTLIGAIVLAGYAQRLRGAINRAQISKTAAIVEEES